MEYTTLIKKVKNRIAFIALYDESNQWLGSGSGFVLSKPEILVTCNHVVKDAAAIRIKFPDSEEYTTAKVVLRDDEHDLALLKMDQKRIPLESGDLSKVEEGMQVMFSGYPLGAKELTTHQGIISAVVEDEIGITSYLIDGTVNAGNSGCPLMNNEGKVIGVVNAKRIVRGDILNKVRQMQVGALSLHGVDLVEMYQVLTNNLQLGVGIAIPASYIPDYKIVEKKQKTTQEGKGK